MGEIITITSGKGGVGKSTATANLAVGLAQELEGKNQKVLAIDFDIGFLHCLAYPSSQKDILTEFIAFIAHCLPYPLR